MRSYLFAPSPDFDRPRTAEARIDRLAATLPAADAAALRAQFASERLAAGSAREAYDRDLDQVEPCCVPSLLTSRHCVRRWPTLAPRGSPWIRFCKA